jgi:parallel beta-helix repeat protein
MFLWPTISTSTAFSVGNDTNLLNPMNGLMDELETFNYPLTAEAIAYGFATFNGCATNNEQDSDYVGRSDVLRTLVDGDTVLAYTNITPCRLGYWRFDTPLWIGEQGQFPSSANWVSMATGWGGGALNIGSAANSGVTYPAVYSNGWASVNCRQGSVRFWFQPNWTSVPASAPFIYVGSGSANYWTLETGTSGNTISFNCASNSASSNPIQNIAAPFSTNQWTQIVFTYGPTGCALYTNGTLAKTNGAVFTNWPNATAQALGMVIGNNAASNNPINGKFDELETFNYQLSANQILTNFQTVWNIDNNLDGIPDIIQDTVRSTSMPFLGQPVVVTGTIEAEQFDRGGPNVAYWNVTNDPTNSYRTTGMCITTNNMPFGYCLDQTRSNEWVNYTINVLVPQTYAIETRVQGLGSNATFEINFSNYNGTVISTGPLTIPGTAWTNITGYATNLPVGTNVMTLKFLSAGISNSSTCPYVGRFDYITVYPWWNPPTFGTTSNYVSGLGTGSDFSTASNNAYLIQSSVNTLGSSGGIVGIEPGTFYVVQAHPNEALDAYPNAVVGLTNSNVKICGAGTNTVLIGYNRATTMVFIGADQQSNVAQCVNITLQGMTFEAQPHMAVNTNNPTNVVYQPGMLLPQVGTTGALVSAVGTSSSTYAYNILFTNCQFIDGDREIDLPGWTSNVLVQDCSFTHFEGTNGIYTPGACNTNIPYSQPENFLLGIFAQSDQNYNIGVVGCSYNGNPSFTNQITSNPNPTNYIANPGGAGNGFLFYQDGGNFFALRNFITNNAEEAIQFGAGPATVAGNTFWSWGNNDDCCALAPNMSPAYGGAGNGTTSYPNYSVTFVGNLVTGNSFGACNDAGGQGPYTLNMSGNSLSLFLAVTNPTTVNLPYGAAVYVSGCQNLSVCGNTMTSGSVGVYYSTSCSNSVILGNNFSGVSRGSLEDWGTGPEIDQQAIGNILGTGYSYHLKAIFQQGPNWFLYNNQYINSNSVAVPPFTDAASLPAHITY